MNDEATNQVESVLRDEMTRTEALAREGKCEVEVWVIINEGGDFQVGADEEQAIEDFEDNHAGYRRRTFRLFLTLPLPQVTEVRGELPEAEGNAYGLEVRPV